MTPQAGSFSSYRSMYRIGFCNFLLVGKRKQLNPQFVSLARIAVKEQWPRGGRTGEGMPGKEVLVRVPGTSGADDELPLGKGTLIPSVQLCNGLGVIVR